MYALIQKHLLVIRLFVCVSIFVSTLANAETLHCESSFFTSSLTRLLATGFLAHRHALSSEKPWGVDGVLTTRSDYESAFGRILENKYGFFRELFQELKEGGRPVHALDLFGSGLYIEDPSLVSSITGVRLGPISLDYLGEKFNKKNWPTEIAGNIFEPSTWSKLDQSMRERKINGFQVITMRPVGGWHDLGFSWNRETKNQQAKLALEYIIEETLKRLANDGIFLFRVDSTYPEQIRDFEAELRERYGLEIFLAEELMASPTALVGMIKKKRTSL